MRLPIIEALSALSTDFVGKFADFSNESVPSIEAER